MLSNPDMAAMLFERSSGIMGRLCQTVRGAAYEAGLRCLKDPSQGEVITPDVVEQVCDVGLSDAEDDMPFMGERAPRATGERLRKAS
jgi:predicted NAD/FAD-dependent oxidoreductase